MKRPKKKGRRTRKRGKGLTNAFIYSRTHVVEKRDEKERKEIKERKLISSEREMLEMLENEKKKKRKKKKAQGGRSQGRKGSERSM